MWVYDRTGSLLVAMLMHFPIVLNAIVLGNEDLSGAAMVISLLAFGAALWVTVAAVALVDGTQFLARPSATPISGGVVGQAQGSA